MATKRDTKDVATRDENAEVDRGRIRSLSTTETFTDKELRSVGSFDDALALIQREYGDVVSVTEHLGNGFALLQRDQKAKLVDVPFLILHIRFSEGDYSDDGFVTMAVVTGKGERFILNDGSTGIRDQLFELVANNPGRYGGYQVPGGLRVSVYDTCFGCGKPRPDAQEVCAGCGDTSTKRAPGETYYLNTSEPQ